MTDSDPSATGPQALELPAGVHQLCSCGRSRHGWFCDGAHLGSGRISHELRLQKAGTVLLCGCGRSCRYPLCDSSRCPVRADGNTPESLPRRRRWPWW